MIYFIIGFIVGGIFGIGLMAVLNAHRYEDDRRTWDDAKD